MLISVNKELLGLTFDKISNDMSVMTFLATFKTWLVSIECT